MNYKVGYFKINSWETITKYPNKSKETIDLRELDKTIISVRVQE